MIETKNYLLSLSNATEPTFLSYFKGKLGLRDTNVIRVRDPLELLKNFTYFMKLCTNDIPLEATPV